MFVSQELLDWILYAGYALTAMSVFFVAYTLLKEQEARTAAENLDSARTRPVSNPFIRIVKPFFSQYVLPVIRSKPYWDEKRKVYRRKLVSAGLREELTPDEFIAFKIFNIVLFPFIFALLKVTRLFPDIDWFVILLSGVGGYFGPELWLRLRIEARQRKIRRAMPFIVDLLALSTEAGLDFVGAIGKVVEKAMRSPLVEEFEQLLKEMKVGASRTEALREMQARIDMSEMNSFVAVLISADQMGAPIGRTLRQQSEQISVERFLRAERAGAAASTKLIIASVIFIVPMMFLLILGAVGLSLMNSGGVTDIFG